MLLFSNEIKNQTISIVKGLLNSEPFFWALPLHIFAELQHTILYRSFQIRDYANRKLFYA